MFLQSKSNEEKKITHAYLPHAQSDTKLNISEFERKYHRKQRHRHKMTAKTTTTPTTAEYERELRGEEESANEEKESHEIRIVCHLSGLICQYIQLNVCALSTGKRFLFRLFFSLELSLVRLLAACLLPKRICV